MKPATLFLIFVLLASTLQAAKMTIEVVSVTEAPTPVGNEAVMNYEAKIILKDGSHALAGCTQLVSACSLDNGHPERLKRTQNGANTITTGYPTFQAKRNGKELTIYTATGKRLYVIVSSW